MGGTAPTPGFGATSTAVRTALINRIGKRGFTQVGYQFQKHFSRGGNWGGAIPQGATLNPATYNQAGYATFKEIWRAPGSFQRMGGFIEKRLPDGRGIRFQQNWMFKGFLVKAKNETMITLTEIVFNGSSERVNLLFLKTFLKDCREVRFNSPEINNVLEYDHITKVFALNDYVDFVITVNKMNIGEGNLQNIFINLGLNNDSYELLFFFDLKDLGYQNYKADIDLLRDWSDGFQKSYNFEYVIYQLDNGDENEYYFDSNGLGPLYKQV